MGEAEQTIGKYVELRNINKTYGKFKASNDINLEIEKGKLIALLGLSGMEKRYPNQLSGGQRQRVAFARALAPNPELLLLDEPFAAIDAKVRQELRSWLRDMITKVGITSIFVTHDQDEAIEVADEIVVTNHGHIEQIGTPREIYREPKTAFMAEFMGQYTHNLDQKNRLAIPAKIREQLGESFVLCKPQNGDRCLYGYANEDWAKMMERFDSQEPSRKLTLQRRLIFKNTDRVEVDKQGRITIPAYFMDAAEFDREIFILGTGRHVEFWNPAVWDAMEAQELSDADDLKVEMAY